ncbi:hypothetical protein ACGF7W_33660 [Streptomyces sp. NPDC048219]|uniref:hypothetical protein n=1 Tax=unclassified Streptomyces TaxID=2593676 RepID=UPI0034316E91
MVSSDDLLHISHKCLGGGPYREIWGTGEVYLHIAGRLITDQKDLGYQGSPPAAAL